MSQAPIPTHESQTVGLTYTITPQVVANSGAIRLDLTADISMSKKYAGFPDMPATEANVRGLYENVLAEYIE